MNFIFVSPNFPRTYWNFCDRLKACGANVLGIGDAPYDSLEPELRGALTEYYKVDSLEDYDQVYRAVAYFAWRYGKIDWIESLNEYWLETDARLRTDFHVTTGIQSDRIDFIKEKSRMKELYRQGGIPTARQAHVTTLEEARGFIAQVGYPVIVKPDIGVGAAHTWKLNNDADLEAFFAELPDVPYVMEEFVVGDLISYEAITDADCEPLFENMTVWPTPIMNIVNDDLDLQYYTCPDLPQKLRKIGRRTAKAFGVDRRFVHLEFFRLTEDRPGLGKKGDYVGLEVNMRPPGGYTPDMINFAHSADVYQIYAEMGAFNERRSPDWAEKYFCVYAGRKEGHTYRHTHEEIMERYGDRIVMQEEMPPVNWPQMGRFMYTARLRTQGEVEAFISFVQS